MKKLLIGAAATAFVFAIAPAAAQTAPPPGVAQGTTPVAPAAPGASRTRMMVMSDRVMTRDEVVSHIRDMFARFDTNRDGYITKEEIEAFHQKMVGAMGMAGDVDKRLAERGIMMGDRGAVFDKLDTNHDGSISRQEFMAAQQIREQRMIIMREHAGGTPGAPGEPGKRMHMHGAGMGMGFGRLFDIADANHDGRVSLAEAQAAALAHFDKADLNHDGRLTPDERRQAHQLMRTQRQPS
jgi:hypothetical protein